ncbi:MAG: RyR domain-containing protein [Candidatus Methylacidiphilales bacterium]
MNLFSDKESANQIEVVAEIIHKNWMLWATELLQHEPNLSTERKQRWENECILPYNELSEQMKNLDRQFAIEILRALK